MKYSHTIGGVTFGFATLRELLAKASPRRSGDELAGVSAANDVERVAAQYALADLPLSEFTCEVVVPYEVDDVTRLIVDTHDAAAFAAIASLTVGEFRDWLLSESATGELLEKISAGLMPEMVAAVSKLMRVQELVSVAKKIRVVTKFRTTVGMAGRLSTRLQPNHPTDDAAGIAAAMLDGLLLGSGDAVIGINPAGDNVETTTRLLRLMDGVRRRFAIPTQSCVLAHVTTQMEAMRAGAPVDLVFQSIGGSEGVNKSFGVTLTMLGEADAMARELKRGGIGEEVGGENVMYFETGQGSALSANAHHDVDQQTMEARAYAVARAYRPMLVNTVVGFIGPEYLYDGKQILRAGLEDHFCGKLMGLPMGCDICYTNHAEADQDDMDTLLVLLGAAGVNYIMGVPGADDVMLNYQSTSFHDALSVRRLLGLKAAPEFEAWLSSAWREELVGLASAGEVKFLSDLVSNAAITAGMTRKLRDGLRAMTPARVGLERAGDGVSTREWLDFKLAHAAARDAVRAELPVPQMLAALRGLDVEAVALETDASTRAAYLRRPDWGRRLCAESLARLKATDCDAVITVCDGLSALAVERHVVALLRELLPLLLAMRLKLATVCVVRQGRVAVGDAIGAAMGARFGITLIGERPGLSSPDSLGAYMTWMPREGKSDAERNCISNIRAEGLSYADAAARIAWYTRAAMQLQMTGVDLKDGMKLIS